MFPSDKATVLREWKGTLAQLQKTVTNRAVRWAGDTWLPRADRRTGGTLNWCHLEIDLKSRHSQQAPLGWMLVCWRSAWWKISYLSFWRFWVILQGWALWILLLTDPLLNTSRGRHSSKREAQCTHFRFKSPRFKEYLIPSLSSRGF